MVWALAACASEPLCERAVPPEGATFLVSRLALEAPTGSGASAVAHGFDLDGVTSTGAGATCVDFSPDHRLAPDGDLPGIDNTIAHFVPWMEELVDPVVDARDPLGLDAAITGGRILLLIQIVPSGEDPSADPILRVYRGTPVDGPLALDVDGRPAPGQRFRGELVGEGALARAGRVRRGAVLESFAATSVDPSPAPPLDLARLTHVGLDVDRCAGADLRGRIGGSWGPEDGATWFRRIGLEHRAEGLISVLSSTADLEPDPIDPSVCGRISLGLSFDVVSAELVP